MNVSTQTQVLGSRFGDDQALEILRDNGFECADFTFCDLPNDHPFFGDDYRAYFQQMRAKADKIGLAFNQAHAHFATFRLGDDAYNEWVKRMVLRALEVSSILGVRVCIVHPQMDNALTLEQEYEMNKGFYASLLPYCKKYGVKVGIENMYKYDRVRDCYIPAPCSTVKDYERYLAAQDSEWFVACLDIGHGEMHHTGDDAVTLIHALGSRLQALHVHDNDLVHDNHSMPFIYHIDWDEITKALHDIGYSGDFTFEADNFLKRFPYELTASASRLMSDVGHYLASRI